MSHKSSYESGHWALKTENSDWGEALTMVIGVSHWLEVVGVHLDLGL